MILSFLGATINIHVEHGNIFGSALAIEAPHETLQLNPRCAGGRPFQTSTTQEGAEIVMRRFPHSRSST
ncbi:hypothetical protein [Methylobacterium sp. NPDC014702]|uniref:hypothetical protein n=1 Tax=unclassified Methylobacterium TaxID=2615210 RepID=UPI0036FFC733